MTWVTPDETLLTEHDFKGPDDLIRRFRQDRQILTRMLF